MDRKERKGKRRRIRTPVGTDCEEELSSKENRNGGPTSIQDPLRQSKAGDRLCSGSGQGTVDVFSPDDIIASGTCGDGGVQEVQRTTEEDKRDRELKEVELNALKIRVDVAKQELEKFEKGIWVDDAVVKDVLGSELAYHYHVLYNVILEKKEHEVGELYFEIFEVASKLRKALRKMDWRHAPRLVLVNK